MGLKNLVVHVDFAKASRHRVEAAIELARIHEAHLTGVAVAAAPSVPAFVEGQVPVNVLQEARHHLQERVAEIAEGFRKKAEAAGISYEVRQEIGMEHEVSNIVARHGRYSDMVVLGQVDPDDPAAGRMSMPEEVVMACGRPVLIIPFIGAKTLGTRVVVAWNAGREAARAVNDALPLLQRAQNVVVMSVNPRCGPRAHGEEPGADIATHLARHKVKVDVQHYAANNINVSDMLLSRVADDGDDLIVMGAYGHARMREMILGGVTREILRSMTAPVLMSH
ncbi:MAG: universal stress protein [Rhodovibrionaceae bacterium]|nr:universal stress protein [Rhodovibrionaceae bacterium]